MLRLKKKSQERPVLKFSEIKNIIFSYLFLEV